MIMKMRSGGIVERFICLSLSQVRIPVRGFKSSSSAGDAKLPPKRPKSAFFLFTAEEMPGLKSRHPELKLVELTKILGQKWSQEIPESKKQEYKDFSAKEMNEYKERMKSFEGKEDLMEELSRQRVEKALKKANRKQKALMLDLGKPRRPPLSPYALFVREKFDEARQKSTNLSSSSSSDSSSNEERKIEIGNVMKAVSDMWAGLEENQKGEFSRKHEAMTSEYGKALAEWETKMSKDGKAEDISKMGEKVKKIRRQKRNLSQQQQQQQQQQA